MSHEHEPNGLKNYSYEEIYLNGDLFTCEDIIRIMRTGNLLFSALDNDLLSTPKGHRTGHLIVEELLPNDTKRRLWEKMFDDGPGKEPVHEVVYECSISRPQGFKLLREIQGEKNDEDRNDIKRSKWSTSRNVTFKDYKSSRMRTLKISFSGRIDFISELFVSIAMRILYAHFSEYMHRPKDEVFHFKGDEMVAITERVMDKFITVRFTSNPFSSMPTQMVG
jgi:hypothetical protein